MNIKDIALLAETSVATVSRVINCDEHVSEKTRQRVLEVIAATGYKPNLVEKALRGQQRGKILVLLPSINNPYYSRVLQGVEHRASAINYDVVVCITHRDYETEKRYLNLVKNNQLEGAILFTSVLPDDELNEFASKYPLVQCGAYAKSSNITYTCIDNITASFEAVSYLVELGNTRIALVNGAFGRAYEIDREEGYTRALQAHGIPIVEEYLVGCDYNHYEGYESCKNLMKLKNPPTAFLCSSDQIAAGVVKYLVEQNIMPGKDADVIGFDGTYISELCTPSITSVEQPGYDMGKTSFDLLFERIQDNKSIIKKVVMSHRLVLRQSTRPKPNKE